MRDVNWPLRQAYFSALTGIDVPVYYQSAPSATVTDYIVFRGITSNDVSTKTSADTSTGMVVEIHTLSNGTNPGYTADSLADDVYSRIYPNPQFNIQIPGKQCVNTKMSNDVTNNVLMRDNRSYISRYITFRHTIFISDQDIS